MINTINFVFISFNFLQTSLQLGSKLLKGLGVMSDDVSFLRQLVRDSMESQAQEALVKTDDQELGVMKPMQVRAADLVGVYTPSNNGKSGMVVKQKGEGTKSKSFATLQEEEEARGVLYCEIGTESNAISSTDEAGEKNAVAAGIEEP